mmetsp:Transcript_13133/g.19317  ORF Transcript_13133/g.19317 Transcript_13133/m.19317 type:complete len:90 (+) Transcript_13133:1052-1321(+)
MVAGHQQLAHLVVSVVGRPVQRRTAVVDTANVGIGVALLQQNPCHVGVIVAGRPVQWRLARFEPVVEVGVGAAVQELLDGLDVAVTSGD